MDLRGEGGFGAADHAAGTLVPVVRQQVAEDLHGETVGVAAKDTETAQGAAGRGLIAGEDAVAGEEEVETKCRGKERGAQSFGLHQRDGEEAVVAEGIKGQTWGKKGLEDLSGQGVSKDKGRCKAGLDRERMSLQQVNQARLLPASISRSVVDGARRLVKVDAIRV